MDSTIAALTCGTAKKQKELGLDSADEQRLVYQLPTARQPKKILAHTFGSPQAAGVRHKSKLAGSQTHPPNDIESCARNSRKM